MCLNLSNVPLTAVPQNFGIFFLQKHKAKFPVVSHLTNENLLSHSAMMADHHHPLASLLIFFLFFSYYRWNLWYSQVHHMVTHSILFCWTVGRKEIVSKAELRGSFQRGLYDYLIKRILVTHV